MKNKKLNLSELKVKSFVTDFKNGEDNTVKGGLRVLRSAGGCEISVGCPDTNEDCQEQTAQNDMTCGLGCFPTDASCGIPCGGADVPTSYC